MFNITLKLEPAEATILEGFLRSRGKQDIRRAQMHLDGPFAERAAVLLEVADQVKHSRQSSPPNTSIPFPDAVPITYTRLLNGLIIELLGRTVESDNHNDWSRVLRSTADQLDELHLGGER